MPEPAFLSLEIFCRLLVVHYQPSRLNAGPSKNPPPLPSANHSFAAMITRLAQICIHTQDRVAGGPVLPSLGAGGPDQKPAWVF